MPKSVPGKLNALHQSCPYSNAGCGSVEAGLECPPPHTHKKRSKPMHRKPTSYSFCLPLPPCPHGSLYRFVGAAMTVIHRLDLNNRNLYSHCSQSQKPGIMESAKPASPQVQLCGLHTVVLAVMCVNSSAARESCSPLLTRTRSRLNGLGCSPWGFFSYFI